MKKRVNIKEEGYKAMFDWSKLHNYFKDEGGRKNKNEKKIIPIVVQDWITLEVLILAYVNKEALEYSLRHRVATFWSTSRNELWVKGLTSGSTLKLIEVRVNCDQNSLLFLVVPVNNAGACHTKDESGYRAGCYYRRLLNLFKLQFLGRERSRL